MAQKHYKYFRGLDAHKKNQMFNNMAFGLVAALGISHLCWLIFSDHAAWWLVLLRAFQYTGMTLVLSVPRMLRDTWRFDVPPLISIFVILYCLCSLILGDGLDLNGRIGWWNSLVLAETGIMLPLIFLWLLHVGLHLYPEKFRYIKHSFQLALADVGLSLLAGAITTFPLYADAAQGFLILFVCAFVVALIGLIRHNTLVEKYRPQPAPVK